MRVGELEGEAVNATRNQIEMPDSWVDPLETATEKVRHPRERALRVAKELCDVLGALCETGEDGRPLLRCAGRCGG